MDVTGLFHVLRRRFPALLLCVLAALGGAVLLTHHTKKVYRATAVAVVTIPPEASVAAGNQGLQLTSDLLPTYAQIATSRSVANRVKAELALPESAEAVRSKLSATPRSQTLLIDISAEDGDPIRARSIANAAAVALSQQVADLESETSVASAIKIDLLDSALTPHKAITPRPVYNLVLGALLGVVAGLALALVTDALDRSVKTALQAEGAAGMPVLALVPRFKRGVNGVVMATDANDPTSEAYRTLRTSVRYLRPDDPMQVILLTSANAGEGKTTTAVNLAVALAQAGERVVLVDADLRRASVASQLGIEGSVGLSAVVTRRVALTDALQRWGNTFDVLPAGDLPPNPSEIVGSQSMASVLEELRQFYDVILVDAPPVLPVTDAVVLSTQVDGVLLVVRAGRTQRQSVGEARRRLDGVTAPMAGTTLNGVKAAAAQGYYAAYHPLAGTS